MFARLLVPLLVKIGPPSFRRWILQFSPPGAVRELTDVVNQIESSTTGILRQKKKALDAGDAAVHSQVGKGKDILSVLRKLFSSHLVCFVSHDERSENTSGVERREGWRWDARARAHCPLEVRRSIRLRISF